MMKQKTYRSILTRSGLVTLFLLSFSCDSILDINEDPFAAGDGQVAEQPGLLMTTIMTNISSDRVMETNLFNRWSQHYVGAGASVFYSADNYSIPAFPQTNTWSTYYVNSLKNASRGEYLANEIGEVNTASQFKIMQAFAFFHLTLMFEDIPFSEALNTDILFPNGDSQEVVLKGIVEMLDEAVENFDYQNPNKVAGEDLLFQGDLLKWTKMANSLKIKTLMIIAEKDEEYARPRLQTAFSQDHIEDLTDQVRMDYYDDLNNANQFYKLHYQYAGGESLFFYASTPFIDLLRGTNDPRLELFYDRPEGIVDAVPHTGVSPGASGAFTSTSVLSLNFITATSPDYWITVAELKFMRAEAILRGWLPGNAADANEYYREGIILNIIHLNSLQAVQDNNEGVTQFEYDNYNNSLPDLQTLAPNNALDAVYLQGYIETFQRGIDAWTYVRRTNYPKNMPLPVDAVLGEHIARLPYSPNEISANPNIPEQKPLDEPMWFMTSN